MRDGVTKTRQYSYIYEPHPFHDSRPCHARPTATPQLTPSALHPSCQLDAPHHPQPLLHSLTHRPPSSLSRLFTRSKGAGKVNYKLRDWLFARQRYWGEPFPVVYPEGSETPVPLPESALPVTLPETEEIKPSGNGKGPLANIEEWVRTVDPGTGRPAVRDTNTMPQWAGSCWVSGGGSEGVRE